MKFSQIGRIAKATAFSLAIGLGVTACSSNYTIDYLYVTSSRNSPGNISAYKVDNQSGALTQMPDSPYSSGGRNPLGIAISSLNKFLFVINHDDSTLVPFAIGTDGKIYPQATRAIATDAGGGSFPTAVTVLTTTTASDRSSSNGFVIVTYTYQAGFTTASPGPGGILVYPFSEAQTDGSGKVYTYTLGTPLHYNLGNNPVSVAATTSGANSYIYAVDQDLALPSVVQFSINRTTGALSYIGGSLTAATVGAGTGPSAIASEPLGHFMYVTDETNNHIIGYLIGSNGALSPMVNGPFGTGQFPVAVTVDPRGKFLYVANFNSTTIGVYAIDPATGTPTAVATGTSTNVGTGPNNIAIEPSRGIYLYTSNFIDNTVTAQQLDPHNGSLINVQNTPFNAAGQPTAVVAAAAGDHAIQNIQQ